MKEYEGYEYKCDKCESVNVKVDFWEDEYSKKSMMTCLTCGHVVGKVVFRAKAKEVLL